MITNQRQYEVQKLLLLKLRETNAPIPLKMSVLKEILNYENRNAK